MSVDVRDRTGGALDGRAPSQRRVGGPARAPGGTWAWIAQVVTGGALGVLVVVHLVAQHFVVDAPAGLRDYDAVIAYLASPALLVIEGLFLLAVTWHAMLGVRAIAFDLGLGPAGRQRVTVAVTVLGVVTLGYGFWLLALLAGAG